MRPARVPSLTGVRAFAALSVYFHHSNPFPKSSFLHSLAQEGYVGVTVFFVLSGFLITWNYADTLRTFEERKRFYLLRFARIVPLYWGLLMGLYLLQWLLKTNDTAPVSEQLFNFSFLKGFIPGSVFSGIPQSWSLTVEMGFYALAPLWISWMAERRWPAVVVLYCFFVCGLFSVYKNHLTFGSFYTIFGRFFEFGAGIFAALWVRQPKKSSGFRFKTLTSSAGGAGLVIAYVLAVHRWHFSAFYTEWLLYNFLLPIVVGFGLVGLLTEKTFLSSLLSSPLAQWMGKSSYAFYLIHLGPVAIGVQRYVSDNSLVRLILLWAMAYALYRWVERPLYRLAVEYSRKGAKV
ncbi:acyltransferase family protein [Runella slithyformis]|uniref:Acyltransferase 3 n=1 Tax=Runella slithyformis (strain ATCC 29530 / DSM 19594 / LMG 11500 / NCIMB 11436 / LSU 4) TaxID=761193 RepID=A0A7U3ZH59_RUNSL|nr:acyltransferase [Runella slithyformis]AEI47047.1 acyltransferase 3 [Runella slithyformis DSM 19594]